MKKDQGGSDNEKRLAVIMCAVLLISTAIISIKAAGAESAVTLGDLKLTGENLRNGQVSLPLTMLIRTIAMIKTIMYLPLKAARL